MDSLFRLKEELKRFTEERDWSQFHSAKNLSMALASEVGELIECFQWLTEKESSALSAEQLEHVCEEIADVQIYLMLLADRLDIDIVDEAFKKITKNSKKYTIKKAKGRPDKYTDL